MKISKRSIESATNTCGIPAAPTIVESQSYIEPEPHVNPPEPKYDAISVEDSDWYIPIKLRGDAIKIYDDGDIHFTHIESIINKIDVEVLLDDDYGNEIDYYNLDNPVDVVENLEEFLSDTLYDVGLTPGTYSISADVTLVYTVSGIDRYGDEYDLNWTTSKYEPRKSFVENLSVE